MNWNLSTLTSGEVFAYTFMCFSFLIVLIGIQGREKAKDRIAWWMCSLALMAGTIILSSAFFNWVVVWTTIMSR